MKIIDIEQGSQEWLDMRKDYITSTDVPTLFGKGFGRLPVDLWKIKVGLKESTVKTSAMQRGLDCEDAARALVISSLGEAFFPRVILSENVDWLMCSLDGISFDYESFIEIKTPMPHNFERAKYEEIPEHYYYQMQTVFACSDGELHKGYYCVYSPENHEIVIREVARDEEVCEKIIEESGKFIKNIRDYISPDPTHKHVTSFEMANAVTKYKDAKWMLEKYEKMKKEAEAELKQIAGDESIEGFGVKLTRYWVKGRIDYKQIDELKHMDLEPYRTNSCERVRISS